MATTSMSGPAVTSGEADDSKLLLPRLPFPFQVLNPILDFVAGVNLSLHTKSLIGFLGGATLLLLMGTCWTCYTYWTCWTSWTFLCTQWIMAYDCDIYLR